MKRYIVVIFAVILAIAADAIIYTSILGEPYGRVPTLYHLGTILMLACAFAIIGDWLFKAKLLR